MSEEDIHFCATLMKAASAMKIYGRISSSDNRHTFQWFDPMAGLKWEADSASSKEEAILNGCHSLAGYVQLPEQPKA